MKNLDVISKRILVTGTVLCAVMLCASLLIFSIGNVTKSYASDQPAVYMQSPTSTTVAGEIMCLSSVMDGKTFYLFWNTSTGKSIRYSYSEGKYVKSSNQLPENPFL